MRFLYFVNFILKLYILIGVVVFVDIHIHEKRNSPDSFLSLEEIVDEAKRKGLDAICITDHDKYDIKNFAEEYSKKINFPIFVGCEYYSREGDILIFGMSDNPGGIETYVSNMINEVKNSDIHFDFLTVFDTIADEDKYLNDGHKVFHIVPFYIEFLLLDLWQTGSQYGESLVYYHRFLMLYQCGKEHIVNPPVRLILPRVRVLQPSLSNSHLRRNNQACLSLFQVN